MKHVLREMIDQDDQYIDAPEEGIASLRRGRNYLFWALWLVLLAFFAGLMLRGMPEIAQGQPLPEIARGPHAPAPASAVAALAPWSADVPIWQLIAFEAFQSQDWPAELTGPLLEPPDSSSPLDFDGDGDVDLRDYLCGTLCVPQSAYRQHGAPLTADFQVQVYDYVWGILGWWRIDKAWALPDYPQVELRELVQTKDGRGWGYVWADTVHGCNSFEMGARFGCSCEMPDRVHRRAAYRHWQRNRCDGAE